LPGYCPEKQKSQDFRRKIRSLAACPGLVLAAWPGFLAVFLGCACDRAGRPGLVFYWFFGPVFSPWFHCIKSGHFAKLRSWPKIKNRIFREFSGLFSRILAIFYFSLRGIFIF